MDDFGWDAGTTVAENGEDWGGTTSQADIDAADEKRLFGAVRSGGIDFDAYNKIAVNIEPEDLNIAPANSFDDMGLPEALLTNIKRMNYDAPTPIQRVAVPIAMAGRDVVSCAQTGSGKTAAFMFVIISKILPLIDEKRTAAVANAVGALPLALIITPTRELAIQIKTEAEKFTFKMPVRPVVCYGGQPRGRQIRQLEEGCDILIATPGRLGDFIENGNVSLQEVKILTLDEADRMLDMGFQDQISEFIGSCPEGKQMLMFSATFEEEVRETADGHMNDRVFISIGRVGSTTDLITQQFVQVEDFQKKDKLMELVTKHDTAKRILVFVERKSTAIDLDRFMDGSGIYATSLHGDRDQEARETALNNFARGSIFLMIATDVAARGLDVDGIDVVINFDMPKNLDSYTHRIGRTGRCGRRGLAISFINSATRGGVLAEIKQQLEETKQAEPEFMEELIAAANKPAGVCYAFQRGECEEGDSCRFSHEEQEGGGGGAGPCYSWQRGDCDRGDECRFSHEGEAGQGGGDRKAGPCYGWQDGTCNRGDECRFSHEGEAGQGGGGPQVCRQFQRGECDRGDGCRFVHEGGGGDAGGLGDGGDGGDFDFGGGFEAEADGGGW